MLRAALASIVLASACRSKGTRLDEAEGAQASPGTPIARREPAKRFAPPLTVVRGESAVGVVGRERGVKDGEGGAGHRLLFAELRDDGSAMVAPVSVVATGEDLPALVVAHGSYGLIVPDGDSARARKLVPLPSRPDGGGAGEPARLGEASCTTAEGVFSLMQEGLGFRGLFQAMEPGGAPAFAPTVPGDGEASVVCGQHQAFVVLNRAGEVSVVAWSKGGFDAKPTRLPKVPSAAAEDAIALGAMEDKLVLATSDPLAIYTLVWARGSDATSWRTANHRTKGEMSIEALEPAAGKIGLVLAETTAATTCRHGESNDTSISVAIVDAENGKLVRPPERLETWRCGAEPGPILAGWASAKFVLAWLRASDAACSRAGVRYAGLGFAEVDLLRGGPSKTGRAGAAAESIAMAGCGSARCFAVAVTRGSTDRCGAADGSEAGKLEVVSFPP